MNIISKDILIVDCNPIMLFTRENNFKNPKRNSRNKNLKPKHNPSASLGCYSYQIISGKKDNFILSWGYRTHVTVSKEAVLLSSSLCPYNIKDPSAARKLIKNLNVFMVRAKAVSLLLTPLMMNAPCNTSIKMSYHGTWPKNLKTREKFRCPFKTSKKFAQKYPLGWPGNHESSNG
jgi:hypothetical protein